MLEKLGHFRDVRHEDFVVTDEMVRRQHHENRIGILGQDPVRCQHDGRSGTAILGLLEHMRLRRLVAQLGRHVRALPGHGHHDRSLWGNQEADPIEGLTEERLPPGENGILLGSVLAVQASRQPCQSRSFAAGEHHAPGVGWAVVVRRHLRGRI